MTVKKTHTQYTHHMNIMASHGISACNTCFLKTYIHVQHAPSNVSSKSIKPTLTVSARFKFCNIFGSWERFTSSQRGHMGVSKCSLLDSYFLPTPAFQRPRHLPAFPFHATGSNEFPRSRRTLSHLTDPPQALKCGAIVCSIFAVIVKTKV